MTPILRALALGYAAPQILEFMGNAFPALKPRIKKAKGSGYSVEQILRFLNQGMGGSPDDNLTEAQIHKKNQDEQGQLVKNLAQLGLGAVGGAAINRALPSIVESFAPSKAAATLPTGIPQGGVQPSIAAKSLLPREIQKLPSQGLEKDIQKTSQIPETSPQPPIDSIPILKQLGLDQKINNLLNAGNDPEIISGLIDQSLTTSQKKWLDNQIKAGKAKSIEEMVAEYAASKPARREASKEHLDEMGKKKSFIQQLQQQFDETYGKGFETEEEAKPIAKGAIVATPSGIVGDVESIRERDALVKDQDGKLHKVKVEDIVESPLPEKDLADLHEELIRGIEKETGEDVSRMVDFAGYDPNTNELAFLPHTGALYIYKDISPERAAQLRDILNVRKTSGENFIGAWKAGSKSPIGASMSKLIQDLQKEAGGKGKEYSNKFETVYKALEPAIAAAKKKKKVKKR